MPLSALADGLKMASAGGGSDGGRNNKIGNLYYNWLRRRVVFLIPVFVEE